MRRPLSIALVSLLGAILVVPAAQAATRRYDFQGGFLPQLRIQVAVFYKNKERHGAYTPRQAIYSATVGVSCDPPIGTATAPTGSNAYGTPNYTNIKVKKGSFSYSYSSVIPTSPSGNISAGATGKMITKKSKKTKHLRVDGSVSVSAYNDPTFGLYNCSTPGPGTSYSASACRYSDSPSYVNGSLPLCSAGPIGVPPSEGCDSTGPRPATDRIAGDVAPARRDPAPRCA